MPFRWAYGCLVLASNASSETDAVTLADAGARLEIGRTLFFGLIASVAVMGVGSVLVALTGQPISTHVIPLGKVASELFHGSKPALLDSGILLLFATPVAGVIVAFAHFVRIRDVAFSAISGALLLVLLAGFLVALH